MLQHDVSFTLCFMQTDPEWDPWRALRFCGELCGRLLTTCMAAFLLISLCQLCACRLTPNGILGVPPTPVGSCVAGCSARKGRNREGQRGAAPTPACCYVTQDLAHHALWYVVSLKPTLSYLKMFVCWVINGFTMGAYTMGLPYT